MMMICYKNMWIPDAQIKNKNINTKDKLDDMSDAKTRLRCISFD